MSRSALCTVRARQLRLCVIGIVPCQEFAAENAQALTWRESGRLFGLLVFIATQQQVVM
jgi:hypothetical protein